MPTVTHFNCLQFRHSHSQYTSSTPREALDIWIWAVYYALPVLEVRAFCHPASKVWMSWDEKLERPLWNPSKSNAKETSLKSELVSRSKSCRTGSHQGKPPSKPMTAFGLFWKDFFTAPSTAGCTYQVLDATQVLCRVFLNHDSCSPWMTNMTYQNIWEKKQVSFLKLSKVLLNTHILQPQQLDLPWHHTNPAACRQPRWSRSGPNAESCSIQATPRETLSLPMKRPGNWISIGLCCFDMLMMWDEMILSQGSWNTSSKHLKTSFLIISLYFLTTAPT